MHRELEFNRKIQPRGYTYLAKIIEIIVPICKDESYTAHGDKREKEDCFWVSYPIRPISEPRHQPPLHYGVEKAKGDKVSKEDLYASQRLKPRSYSKLKPNRFVQTEEKQAQKKKNPSI